VHLQRKVAISTRLTVLVVVVILVAAAGAYLGYEYTVVPASQVTFSLESAPNAFDAPIYYGLQQGFYKNEGLNVSLQAGKGTAGTISNVASGSVEFGLADTPGMIFALANSNISNVRIVAMLYQQNFYAVFYDKAHIASISDLQGKTGALADPKTSTLTPMFDLFAKMNRLNLSSMTLQYSTSSLFTYLVAQGKADFTTNKIHNLPAVQAVARQNGIQVGAFSLSHYGLDTYGEALLTTTQMIQAHSDVVQKMVKATMEGVIAAESNPSAAVSALVTAQPQLNQTVILPGFELDLSCCTKNATSTTDPLVFGWIDPQRMQQTVSLVVEGLAIRPINASNLYTDGFTKAS
jgi:NitT/TauT family transport system substrate-binding protein